MNDELINEAILNVISVLLVLGAIGISGLYWIAYKMEQANDILHADERDTDPQPYGFRPDAEYVRQVLDELGLRKEFATYRNMDGAAQADIADLKRGTSDNLRGLL